MVGIGFIESTTEELKPFVYVIGIDILSLSQWAKEIMLVLSFVIYEQHYPLTYLAIRFLAIIIPMPVVIQIATPTALIIDVNASGRNLRPTIMKIMPKPITHHSLLLGIPPPGIALRSRVKRLWSRLAGLVLAYSSRAPLGDGTRKHWFDHRVMMAPVPY
jgi:hypothetical protein